MIGKFIMVERFLPTAVKLQFVAKSSGECREIETLLENFS